MKACQLCGARSWGPPPYPVGATWPDHVIRMVTAARTSAFQPGLMSDDNFRVCDYCGSYAALDLIEEESGPQVVNIPMLPDPLAQVGEMLQSLKPERPISRTEMLVREILAGGSHTAHSPRDLVAFVRALEVELDKVEVS